MGNFSFNDVPILRRSRSRFDLSHSVKTSGNVGTLYPFEVQEVYAGDTFKINTNVVARLSSQFIRPVMDNLFLDVYYFYVPSRLLYGKYVNIFGENTDSEWANTADFEVPAVFGGTVESKTVADYLGLPVGLNAEIFDDISVLPFRAFAKIYNEWFRDQNNVSPMHIQNDFATASESFNNSDWAPNNYFGKLPKVGKLKDYFTSALPAPQKGNPVQFNVVGQIPVKTSSNVIPSGSDNDVPLRFRTVSDGVMPPSSGLGFNQVGGTNLSNLAVWNNTGGSYGGADLKPVNLFADGSSIPSISVNELRYAFQTQKLLERDARSGSRYISYLNAAFGVSAGDYRLQRSEYLGGRRIPISIQQVTQTTGYNDSKATNSLANVGAFSLTNGRTRVTKSFVENGYVIGVFCIRQFHTYQQGVEKFWRRRSRLEFYDPVFSNIGEQPIMKTELYYDNSDLDQPFGYGEAWADLRYRPNRVTGQMRSGVNDSFDIWHFADNYSNAPTLNKQFIEETPTYVNRAITVDSNAQDQFILDFYIQNIAYRCMPTYSVPSLIDHN